MNPTRPAPGLPRVTVPRIGIAQLSLVAVLVLVAGSWFFVLGLDRQQPHAFFSAETAGRMWSFLKELLGIDSGRGAAFMEGDQWRTTGRLAYQTLAMSVLAVGLAAAGALATFMFGARNVMMGDLAPTRFFVAPAIFFVVRAFFTLTRAIPELVWAMLIVFVLSPGILPGAIALALHNWGVLGKLSAEVVEGMDVRSARALQAAGASRLQVLAYGVLPQALPRFLTYTFYRWEVIIRTTIVVGFVSAGGLGMAFRLSMSHFHYTTVTLLLMWYLLLVVGVDLLSAGMRRLAR